MRGRAVFIALAIAAASGCWTCSRVVAEKPVGHSGRVLGFFDGAPATGPFYVLVDNRSGVMSLLKSDRDALDIPSGTTVVERPTQSAKVASMDRGCDSLGGGPTARIKTKTVAGELLIQLVMTCDGSVDQFTYKKSGTQVRFLTAAKLGQLGPLIALFDGFITFAAASLLLTVFALVVTPKTKRRQASGEGTA